MAQITAPELCTEIAGALQTLIDTIGSKRGELAATYGASWEAEHGVLWTDIVTDLGTLIAYFNALAVQE